MSQEKLRRIGAIALVSLSLSIAASPGYSQTSEGDAKESETPEVSAPRIKTLPPAYGPQLLRLSEILGSLHYLRTLCNANEGQLWRDQMNAIIANEDPTEERKAELISNFNRGFRSFREIHRECTQTAVEAANFYLNQGRKLSAEIPDRYGR